MVHKDLLPLNLDDAVMVSMASVGLSIAAGGGEEPGILEERECRMGCEKRE